VCSSYDNTQSQAKIPDCFLFFKTQSPSGQGAKSPSSIPKITYFHCGLSEKPAYNWSTGSSSKAEGMAIMRALESPKQREASRSRMHAKKHMNFAYQREQYSKLQANLAMANT
jgi:hypothetical protein